MPHFVVSRWDGVDEDHPNRKVVGVYPTFHEATSFAAYQIEDVIAHFYHIDDMHHHRSWRMPVDWYKSHVWSYDMDYEPNPDGPNLLPYARDWPMSFDQVEEILRTFVVVDEYEGDKGIRTINPLVSVRVEGKKLKLNGTLWQEWPKE